MKNEQVQEIRGICILTVLMIHSLIGPLDATGMNYYIWLCLRVLISFPVAVFFFLAGYYTNINKCQNSLIQYFVNRGRRLLIPYLVWTSIYNCIVLFKVIRAENCISFKAIVLNYITGSASWQLYYILVLLQLTVLTPLLIKCMNSRWMSLCCYAITPAYLCFLFAFVYCHKSLPPWYHKVFAAWFLFYYLGLKVRNKNPDELKKRLLAISNNSISRIILGMFAVSLIEAILLKAIRMPDNYATTQVRAGAFLYAASICLFTIVQVKKWGWVKTRKRSFLIFWGDYSYFVYYAHMIFLETFSALFQVFWEQRSGWFMVSVCRFGFTVIGCFGLILLMKKIKMNNLKFILGYPVKGEGNE